MSKELLQELINQSDTLSSEERLQLMYYLASSLKQTEEKNYLTIKPQRKWSEIKGKIHYPIIGEDAQTWVSKSRQEATKNREEVIINYRDN